MNEVIVEITTGMKKYEAEKGNTLERYFANVCPDNKYIVLGKVNNEIKPLTFKLEENANVEPVDLKTTNGQKSYKQSLVFLLAKAMNDVVPDHHLIVRHTINKAMLCSTRGKSILTKETVKKIKERMIELVELNLTIHKTKMPAWEASELFARMGKADTAELLATVDKKTVSVYNIDGYLGYFLEYLVPSTGYLGHFDLFLDEGNIILTSPKKEQPAELESYTDRSILLDTFNESKEWQQIIGMDNVYQLNASIINNKFGEYVRLAEVLHENKLAKIAEDIVKSKSRVVLIAGPSSSGKTSTSKRLELQLKVHRITTYAISLDDYFIERDKTPRDDKGEPDFESIHALDLELFNDHLKRMLLGEEVCLPTYNFKTGKREYNNRYMKLGKNQVVIIEGIHGLNPLLTSSVSETEKFKIFVCPITQLNLDEHNKIPMTDSRLLRRIVRDNQFRNHNAKATIKMWPSVRDGEEKNIIPFKEEAQIVFNSSLIYELATLKKYAEPLLKKITTEDTEFVEANRLVNLLSYFKELPTEADIPPTSIIKEFIGNQRLF